MEWFSNPAFWSLFYNWMFPPKSFAEAKKQIDDIVRLSGVSQGSVLDLCCGPGRHSVPLAKAGFDVTAVDLEGFLLEKARAYAERESVAVEFVNEDMRGFRRAESFDLIINMFSSFGYFEDSRDDLKVLENAAHSLRPGGRLLIDVRGKEIHARENAETVSYEMPSGDLIFHRNVVCEDWTRSRATWVYVQGKRAHTFNLIYNLYSAAELRALLSEAGFSAVAAYGNLKGEPYDDKAERLVAVATKAVQSSASY